MKSLPETFGHFKKTKSCRFRRNQKIDVTFSGRMSLCIRAKEIAEINLIRCEYIGTYPFYVLQRKDAVGFIQRIYFIQFLQQKPVLWCAFSAVKRRIEGGKNGELKSAIIAPGLRGQFGEGTLAAG